MAKVVKIGSRRWLVGMTWSSFENAPTKAEVKEDAQRLGASWACVRIGEAAIQAGFCDPVEGIRKPKKLYSLAAMLADSHEQPWLGIFRIAEDLWWYVAVRDGHAILPDGDIVGGEEEIHAARERHSGYTDWKYIQGDLSLLEEFINEVDAKPSPVRSLEGVRISITSLVVASTLIFAVAGGAYWWWHQKQVEEELARQAAMARARAMLAQKQVPAPVPSPLLTTPNPNDWLNACGSVILPLPLSLDGWALEIVGCEAGNAVVHWSRKHGATVAKRPEGELTAEGEKVIQTIPLVGIDPAGKDDAVNLEAAKRMLRAWSQAASFTLSMKSEESAAPVLPGAEKAPESNKPQHPSQPFILDMPVSPFGMDFSIIPGLRISRMNSTASGWKLEGTLYGR